MKTLTNFVNKKFFLSILAVIAVFTLVSVETASAAYVHTVTLKLGSTGTQVLSLQQTLNAAGFRVATVGAGAPGFETTFFGPRTLAAVRAFQAAKGLVADGIVGPRTGAALAMVTGGVVNVPLCPNGNTLASNCTVPPGGTVVVVLCPNGNTLASNCTMAPGSTSTPLSGKDGDLKDIREISTDDSKFQEGQTSELFGFKFEVEGDVTIDRIDFYLDSTDAGSQSNNADDYFKSAVLMVDGKKVATLDVDKWDEDSYNKVDVVTGDSDEYRLRFSGLNWKLSDGDMPEVVLAFEVNNTIDSNDLSETWGVELVNDSIRFVDGKGFSDSTGVALEESFSGESEDTAELKVQTSTNDPDASVITTSDSGTTDGVAIFKFKISEENGVDATINDLRVTLTALTSAGAGVDESTVLRDAHLFAGTKELGSESVASGGQVTFENIDLNIDANDSVELTLKVDIADADNFAAGDTLSATISGPSDITDAEDANGNDEGDMTLSGSATSETHSLQKEGIMATFVDSSYTKTSSDTAGVNETVEFTLRFDVTAFGDDIYVEKSCIDAQDPGSNTTDVVVSLDGDTDGDNTSCTSVGSTGTEGTNGFLVREGTTERFTVTVLGNGGEAGGAGNSVTFRARLESIGYKVGSDAAGDQQYTFNLDDFKSQAVTVFDR